ANNERCCNTPGPGRSATPRATANGDGFPERQSGSRNHPGPFALSNRAARKLKRNSRQRSARRQPEPAVPRTPAPGKSPAKKVSQRSQKWFLAHPPSTDCGSDVLEELLRL